MILLDEIEMAVGNEHLNYDDNSQLPVTTQMIENDFTLFSIQSQPNSNKILNIQ